MLQLITVSILNITESSDVQVLSKLFIVSLLTMFGHVILYGQAANIAAGLDSESDSNSG